MTGGSAGFEGRAEMVTQWRPRRLQAAMWLTAGLRLNRCLDRTDLDKQSSLSPLFSFTSCHLVFRWCSLLSPHRANSTARRESDGFTRKNVGMQLLPPGQTKHELWRFVFPLAGSELLAKKNPRVHSGCLVLQPAKLSAFFYNKLTRTTIFSIGLAAIHEVLVLKSAHASFTTPLIRMPVHGYWGLPQNKGFERM